VSVGLYVMTEKGLAVLQAALDADIEIAHVTTAEAKGMNDLSHQAISETAKAHGIPTFVRAHPPEFTGSFSLAAGWRWMLHVPQLVVLHDSLLPRYRGFSPLVTALVNGEPEIGVTAFLAEQEPDTGPIIAQRSIPVVYPTRVRDVLDRLIPVYGELAAEVLAGDLRSTPQDHARATYSLWRDEDDYRIDWGMDDRRICRLIDAVSDPFPGAWTTVDGATVRVLKASVVPDRRIEDRTPGKIAYLVGDWPIVVCGTGLVSLGSFGAASGFPFALKTKFV
jgi:methionyl-tRNA formyltransferase